MRKRKYILGEAGALLIIAALIISMVAATATAKNEQPELTLNTEATQGVFQNIVWDNGLDYTGLGAAQWDEPEQFDAYCADDFEFTELTEVCDVHWIGGYWGGDPAEFDWGISFYLDDGTDNAPVGIPFAPSFAGPFIYTWAEIVTEELEPGYYEMSVDLPENIPFPPGKYWISIWGIGAFPPQSGWGYHDTILLHQGVFGSAYFGFPFWTNSEDVFGVPYDFAFQLTTKLNTIPDLSCDGSLVWDDVKPGGTVTGEFYVGNIGEVGSMLNWEIDEEPTWGTWTFIPDSGTLADGDWETIAVEVVAPPDENTEFTGTIKIINVDDPSDYCEIPVILKTPVNQNSIFLQVLKNFVAQRFSISTL